MNVFVFDIETVPDVVNGRCLYGNSEEMQNLSDKDVWRVMSHYRHQETDGRTEMMRHHLQKIVAISVVLRSGEQFKVWSLGELDSAEEELIQRFFSGVDKYTPTLVSWNGGGFDLPVLHYRALLHGISSKTYWQTLGDFRFNNYLNRYHERHIDLMDMVASYQPQAYAQLNQIAIMLGLPGKLGMSGDKVWDTFLDGDIESIRNYCETDVLNTYLIFLRFELIRGRLTQTHYDQECELVRDKLNSEDKPHFKQFLEAWG